MEGISEKMDGKIVQPDDKEAVITQGNTVLRWRGAKREADERWKKRMANEDKITTNTIEVLRSDMNRLSAKMVE